MTVFALLLAFAACARPSAAAGLPTLTPGQLDAQLETVAQDCRLAAGGDTTIDPAAAMRPIALCVVQPAGQAASVVRNQWLLAEIKDAAGTTNADDRKANLAAAAIAIEQWRQQLSAKPIDGDDRADAVSSMRRELSASLYGSDPIPPPSGAQKALQDFWKWLSKKLTPKSGPSPTWPTISVPNSVWIGLLIILIVFVVCMLAWFVLGLIRSSGGGGGLRRRKAESLLAMTDEEAQLVAARDFDKLLDLARHRADAADYRSAVRLVYLATLVTLDSLNLVRLIKSRTNWEYLRDLQNGTQKELAVMIRPMTVDFDRIWYGSGSAGRDQYQSALDQHMQLRSVALARVDAPPATRPLAVAALTARR